MVGLRHLESRWVCPSPLLLMTALAMRLADCQEQRAVLPWKGSCAMASSIQVSVTCNADKSATISWSGEKDSKVVVKVKGGPGGELYDTVGKNQGTFFAGPAGKGSGRGGVAGISHIEFCVQCACKDCGSECTIHGDPHITVFDHAESSVLALDEKNDDSADFYGWGDFWLVKSEQVSIQGRYCKVYYPKASEPLNHSYLTSMAVSGPFMKGHKVIIEPRLGDITWSHAETNSHQNILNSGEEDSLFEIDGVIKARYHNRTAIVSETKPVVAAVDLELPSQVKLFVDRFKKHLNLRISMPPSAGGKGGIDGQCGNFSGDPLDDTAELINKRIGYQVPASELLFEKNSISEQA